MQKQDIIRSVHQMARSGQAAQAIQSLAPLVQNYPSDPDFTHHMGLLLISTGKHDEALPLLERSVQLAPGSGEYRSNYATALNIRGRYAEAANEYRRVLAIMPTSFPAQLGLSSALVATQDYDGALAAAKQANALDPKRPEPWLNMAIALTRSGRGGEGLKVMERALERIPNQPVLLMNFVANLHYRPEISPERIRTEHERLGGLIALSSTAGASFSNSRDPERTLRVGYVSPDFREHPVAYFFSPILKSSDAAQVQNYCYSAVPRADTVTEELTPLAHKWRDITRINDAELESYIRGDQIDILVDLAGHTAGSRLPAFARRLAPVQISYLGYPNTTGLPAIDYRIVDSLTDPAGAERYSSETLIRLDPSFLCYAPPEGAPDAALRPAGAPLTFASFNSAQKIVEPVIKAWADILKAVPNSRLLLKTSAFESEPTRRDYRKLLEHEGVSADRIDFRGRAPARADHLSAYHDADIALDTFPYCGTTTTCEAIFMGVPVVTLAGAAHAGRVGVSLLTNLGLTDLIADTTESYVAKAVALANDASRRASLRSSLRARLLQSPLCDQSAFTKRLEHAYRTAWRKWCETPKA